MSERARKWAGTRLLVFELNGRMRQEILIPEATALHSVIFRDDDVLVVDDGYWLSRYIRFRQNCSAASGPPGPGGGKPGCDMDELYNHSSFIDLIIAAIVGLRPSVGPTLSLNPLGVDRRWFALDNLRYRGHDVAIAYDAAGERYAAKGCGGAKRLCVWVDGKLAAAAGKLGPMRVKL